MMRKFFGILAVVALLGISAAPVLAQGQNTADGVNEKAREQMDENDGIDKATEKMAEGEAKAEENTDMDIVIKGKQILEGAE